MCDTKNPGIMFTHNIHVYVFDTGIKEYGTMCPYNMSFLVVESVSFFRLIDTAFLFLY